MGAELTSREVDLIVEARDTDDLLERVHKIIVERYFNPDGIEYGN